MSDLTPEEQAAADARRRAVAHLPNKLCNCGSRARVGLCDGPGCKERAAKLQARRGQRVSLWGAVVARVFRRKPAEPNAKPPPAEVVRLIAPRPPQTPKHLRQKKPRPGKAGGGL